MTHSAGRRGSARARPHRPQASRSVPSPCPASIVLISVVSQRQIGHPSTTRLRRRSQETVFVGFSICCSKKLPPQPIRSETPKNPAGLEIFEEKLANTESGEKTVRPERRRSAPWSKGTATHPAQVRTQSGATSILLRTGYIEPATYLQGHVSGHARPIRSRGKSVQIRRVCHAASIFEPSASHL